MDALEQKYQRLQDILTQFSSVAVAFSGGVDSTFLLYAAQDTLGGNALAVTAVTAALPQRERQGAEAICAQLGVRRLVYPLDVLALPAFQTNPPDRCYHCKKALFQGMLTLTQAAGFPTLVDASNVDDTGDYRPWDARPSGAGHPKPSPGRRSDESRHPCPVPPLPPAHLGPTQRRLPGLPHPLRRSHHRGEAGAGGTGGAVLGRAGTDSVTGTPPRPGIWPASRCLRSSWRWC